MNTKLELHQQGAGEQNSGRLLSPEERTLCERLAAEEAPHSQRALALLAIDEGASQVAAGQRTGLSTGQVHYWLGKFRERHLAIFPEAMLAPTEAHSRPAPVAAEQIRSEEDVAPDRPAVEERIPPGGRSATETVEARAIEERKLKKAPKQNAKKADEPLKAEEPGLGNQKAKKAKKPKKTKKAEKTMANQKAGKKRKKARAGKKTKEGKGSKKSRKSKGNQGKSSKKRKKKKSKG